MVSHRYKFVFVHIIKTGGTSIEQSLKSRVPRRGRSKMLKKTHIFSRNYKKIVGKKKWNKYFTFSFVRNPWDKMVSSYFYAKQIKKNPYKDSFEQFIQKFNNCPVDRYEIYNDIPIKFNPVQLPWILDDNGQIMVDFVGRFEEMQKGFNIVCKRIGVKKRRLPRKNSTKHMHYSHYYNQETKNIVAKKFEKDIDFFSYRFESK